MYTGPWPPVPHNVDYSGFLERTKVTHQLIPGMHEEAVLAACETPQE